MLPATISDIMTVYLFMWLEAK